jgi:DNA-binding NarL/FixJ family response regulator
MNKASESFKVIIADDHPIFRSGINSALKGVPFISKVSEAANGEEVIKLLSNEKYDLVLMDIKMSPMNGLEATETIGRRYPATKVIVLSMHDDEEYIIEIFSKGASGYLVKNADKAEILEAILVVMKGNKYFSKEVSAIMIGHLSSQHPEEKDNADDSISKERMREIIYLICQECTSQEVADLLYLSLRTIETYRSRILKVTKSKNLIGLLKYAQENKILEDVKLKERFKSALAKRKKN